MALPPIQTTSVQTTPPLSTVRRHRAELLETMHALERVLAAPAAEPNWRSAVTARLSILRSAFAEHMRLTEGPEGLYAELLEHAPRLAYRVRGLVREHASLALGIDAVCSRVGSAAPDDMRGWTSNLLRDLSRHRQRGADLVYEAYATDIGGET
jgi:hypothetical protein